MGEFLHQVVREWVKHTCVHASIWFERLLVCLGAWHGRLRLFAQELVTHHQHIHVGEHETAIGVARIVHNGFAANIETGVHQHRATRAPLKCLQNGVKSR